MTHSSFDERRRALENAFFHKRDSDLLQQLRERMERGEAKTKLAEVTGIRDEALLERLVGLQITPETLDALNLAPLVEIAWADGTVHAKQREAVLTAAEQSGVARASMAGRLLVAWLDAKPGPELLQTWKDYVHCQSQRMGREALEALRDDIMDRALFVAEATGGVFGFHRVARQERAKLDELGDLLEELAAAFA
jgi:hypothetical protein